MLFFAVQLFCLFTRILIILQFRKKVTNPEFIALNINVQSRDCSRFKRAQFFKSIGPGGDLIWPGLENTSAISMS